MRVSSRWIASGLLIGLTLYGVIVLRFRLEPEALLSPERQTEVIRYLRKAAEGIPRPELGGVARTRLPGPIWITVYHRGVKLLRHRAEQPTLGEALSACARVLAGSKRLSSLSPAKRARTRIKVDLMLAEGPIISSIPLIFAMSVVPGLDGLGLTVDQETTFLLPDDLFKHKLFAGTAPFYFIPEFRTGLELTGAVNRLADQLEISAEQWRRSARRYFRFRVQSFVESPDQRRALGVLRSRVPVERIDRQLVRQAVTRSADYVLRQLKGNGEFKYIYHPLHGEHEETGYYSLPRHAGTSWFLSLAYEVLKLPRLKEGARRAIEYLVAHAVPPACRATPYACIGTNAEASLGSAALGLVAIAEYQQATGEQRFLALARRLGRFIIWMQRADGDFCHIYYPATMNRSCEDKKLYYSGEAALALAKLHQLTKDPALVSPLERALDFLTDEKYDFFMGKFFVSEDHWTCIAAEAAFAAVNKDQYAEFCYEFAAFGSRAQFGQGGLTRDLRGAFAITPFFLPQNCATGSRTEANVATYLLSLKRKEDRPEILAAILSGARYLVDQQLRPESSYLFPRPDEASGGMMQTAMTDTVRIDFVQHTAAALARGLQLVP